MPTRIINSQSASPGLAPEAKGPPLALIACVITPRMTIPADFHSSCACLYAACRAFSCCQFGHVQRGANRLSRVTSTHIRVSGVEFEELFVPLLLRLQEILELGRGVWGELVQRLLPAL